MITSRISSSFRSIPSPRTTKLSSPRSRYPPPALRFAARRAAATSAKVQLCACRRTGSTRTWYCLSWPPMVLISVMPGMLRSLGTISQSSSVRSCMGECTLLLTTN
jgi:hypothetical protein